MRAARFHGPGDLRIDEVPDPEVGPGQVEVSVDWCGICGTDLHEFLEGPIFIPPKGSPRPITGVELPVVMGHEFAGVVSAIGSGVTGVQEGDRVAVEPPAVGYHAVRLSGIREGGTAAVFGSGPIGLVTASVLKVAGAKAIVVEPAAARKAKARGIGVDQVLDPAIGSVRPGGTVVNVAIWGHVRQVAMNDRVLSEITVVGSLAYCADHSDTIALLRDGKVDADPFITGRIGLDSLVDGGFRELIDNKEENVRILVSPQHLTAEEGAA